MREDDIRTLSDGSHFNFKGFEWIALDNNVDGGVLAIMASAWNGKTYCFDGKGYNNYLKSNLREKLRDELLPVLGKDNLIPHEVSLVADNGDDLYCRIYGRVFILSCDEYREHRKNVPLLQERMWTCTPSYISDDEDYSYVRIIDSKGKLYDATTKAFAGVLPACVFNPEKVKVGYTIPTVEERSND